MSEPTAVVDAPAPAPPDPSTIASLADYEAARPQLLKDSSTPPERGDSADTIRERLLGEQEERVGERARDPRGRFTKADAPEAAQAAPDTAEAQPAEAVEAPAPERRKNPQERIAHVVWEREQARREAAALRQQLDALQQGRMAPEMPAPSAPTLPQAPPAPQAQVGDPPPSEEHYQTYAEFVAATARWSARQQYLELLQHAQAQAEAQQTADIRQTRASAFAERMQAAEQAEPALLTGLAPEVLDLRPAMSLQPGESPDGGTAIADALLEMEHPQHVMRYLSDHPDDFRRIRALHPMLAMREVGRIEARLDAASHGSASQPSLSQAKPPIQPVGRGASVPTGARDPKDISSLAEWEAVRRSFGAR
jgi:hypothetical protein